MTIAVAFASIALPHPGQSQATSELKRLEAAVMRELVPLPLEEARNYVAEGLKEWLPSPGSPAYKELEALRQQHVDAVDGVEIDILSATFMDDYALVLAHVLVVYKANVDIAPPTSAEGDLELYQFVRREDGEWLAAATPFPYTPQSFLQMYTSALEKHAGFN